MIASYAWKLVARNKQRSFTFVFGLVLSIGLFSGILFFIDTMSRGMTQKALAPVTLDMVAHTVKVDEEPLAMVPKIAAIRGVSAVESVASADFATAMRVPSILVPSSGKSSGSVAGGTTGTGNVVDPLIGNAVGRMFAINPSYLSTFNLVKISQGSFQEKGVVVSESMAVARKLALGESLNFSFSGLKGTFTLPITGIANMEGADALFSTATEAENSIVSDVVFVDYRWFKDTLLPDLRKLALNPATVTPPGGILLDQQLHIKIDRTQLPSDPVSAAIQADALRRSIERQYSGDLKVVDNISGNLSSTKSDVLSAKILFIFLGLPGILLAAYLSVFVTELFADSRRREISLLRTRGARPGQITGIVALANLYLSILGSLAGILLGLLLISLTQNLPLSNLLYEKGILLSGGFAFLVGIGLSFVAGFLPSLGILRREVLEDRMIIKRRSRVPFWKRSYLDFLFLGLSLAILVVTQLNGGLKPTGTEGQAVQLSFYIFLSPLFAWIGTTLLTIRIVTAYIENPKNGLSRLFKGLMGGLGEMSAQSMARRSISIASAVTVIALTLSFGISLLIFQQTYNSEKRLDSQYIVGADIRLTPALNTPQKADFAKALMVPGVASVTPVYRDTQALIGMEKNTVYGIDIKSFRKTAYLPNSFFVNGNSPRTLAALRDKTTDYAPGKADQVLQDLENTPNGVLISVEQAQKYNIQLGDPVRIKLYNRFTNEYKPVEAQAVGFFVYFATSSQDSDFILNSSFMTRAAGFSGVDNFLIRVDSSSLIPSVSERLRKEFKNLIPLRIQNTDTVIKVDSSSLTALNLEGLVFLELLYTILVATIGLAVFLYASVNERRREFGTMRAFGADLGHLRRILFSESLTITLISLLMGILVGGILSELLVALLSSLFTIPPRGVVIPTMHLGLLMGIVLAGLLASTVQSARHLEKIKVVEALREL